MRRTFEYCKVACLETRRTKIGKSFPKHPIRNSKQIEEKMSAELRTRVTTRAPAKRPNKQTSLLEMLVDPRGFWKAVVA